MQRRPIIATPNSQTASRQSHPRLSTRLGALPRYESIATFLRYRKKVDSALIQRRKSPIILHARLRGLDPSPHYNHLHRGEMWSARPRGIMSVLIWTFHRVQIQYHDIAKVVQLNLSYEGAREAPASFLRDSLIRGTPWLAYQPQKHAFQYSASNFGAVHADHRFLEQMKV